MATNQFPMYLINTSFFIGHEQRDVFLEIAKGTLIPLLLDNGFTDNTLSRVISEGSPEQTVYSLMVRVPDTRGYAFIAQTLFKTYKKLFETAFPGTEAIWLTTLLRIENQT